MVGDARGAALGSVSEGGLVLVRPEARVWLNQGK